MEINLDKAGILLVFIVILFGLGVTGYTFHGCATTDGRPKYCYITGNGAGAQPYRVMAYREWRADTVVGNASTPQEADKILRDSAICSELPRK